MFRSHDLGETQTLSYWAFVIGGKTSYQYYVATLISADSIV